MLHSCAASTGVHRHRRRFWQGWVHRHCCLLREMQERSTSVTSHDPTRLLASFKCRLQMSACTTPKRVHRCALGGGTTPQEGSQVCSWRRHNTPRGCTGVLLEEAQHPKRVHRYALGGKASAQGRCVHEALWEQSVVVYWVFNGSADWLPDELSNEVSGGWSDGSFDGMAVLLLLSTTWHPHAFCRC
jgi:hypothetical protein